MWTSAFFGEKRFGFFEIMVCPHGHEGGGRVWTSADILRTSFTDNPLW